MFSSAIEREYHAVLARPKFNIEPQALAAFFDQLRKAGQHEDSAPKLAFAVPDPKDAPFLALARYAGCPVITGNTKHFPPKSGVVALTPAQWLVQASE